MRDSERLRFEHLRMDGVICQFFFFFNPGLRFVLTNPGFFPSPINNRHSQNPQGLLYCSGLKLW